MEQIIMVSGDFWEHFRMVSNGIWEYIVLSNSFGKHINMMSNGF